MSKRHPDVCIRVDEEYPACAWWDAARAHLVRFPESVQPLFDTVTMAVTVSDRDFWAFYRIARQLPGWVGGPRFATCPVTMTEVQS